MRWRWWLVMIVGVWDIACGWIFSAAREASYVRGDFLLGGILIALGGLWMGLVPRGGICRVIALAYLGLWMAASPWIFAFQRHTKDTPATVVAGLLVFILAALTVVVRDTAEEPRAGRHLRRRA
ncbi:MAG: SPW repeat protein [Firmicutes bacterium]|nr:SPW repeat protein [Bacillota bacterium]